MKRPQGSFSACLFLIDIKNENGSFLTPPNPRGEKKSECTEVHCPVGEPGGGGFDFVLH